jgi:hypothetical protein
MNLITLSATRYGFKEVDRRNLDDDLDTTVLDIITKGSSLDCILVSEDNSFYASSSVQGTSELYDIDSVIIHSFKLMLIISETPPFFFLLVMYRFYFLLSFRLLELALQITFIH